MNFTKIDAYMENMGHFGIPGAQIAIAKDGEVVYKKCVGYADHEKKRALSETDISWIFSCTKVITCIAAMRLFGEGKLSIYDPVSKYIPEFSDVLVCEGDTLCKPRTEMTLEHLFTMTAGLDYNINAKPILEARKKEGATTLDIVRAMAKAPLAFHPSEHFLYSLCHDVLGAIIEVVSGERLSDYLKNNIFEPLGIADMGFHPTEEQKARFCDQYAFLSGSNRAIPRPLSNCYQLSPDYDSAGAGLFASVDSYIKIISAVANGGVSKDGYEVISEDALKMMTENRLNETALNDFVKTKLFGYGWGLCGRVHADPVISHSKSPVGEFGWDGAAGSFALIDPTNRVAIYYCINTFDNTFASHVIHQTLRDLTYEALGL